MAAESAFKSCNLEAMSVSVLLVTCFSICLQGQRSRGFHTCTCLEPLSFQLLGKAREHSRSWAHRLEAQMVLAIFRELRCSKTVRARLPVSNGSSPDCQGREADRDPVAPRPPTILHFKSLSPGLVIPRLHLSLFRALQDSSDSSTSVKVIIPAAAAQLHPAAHRRWQRSPAPQPPPGPAEVPAGRS